MNGQTEVCGAEGHAMWMRVSRLLHDVLTLFWKWTEHLSPGVPHAFGRALYLMRDVLSLRARQKVLDGSVQ